MEINRNTRTSPKRIAFNVSEEDHGLIKTVATAKRTTMTLYILKAIADAIRRDESGDHGII